MLIINNDAVSELLTMADCIRVQEDGVQASCPRAAPSIGRASTCTCRASAQDGYFRWGTMEGANDGYFAIRMKSDIMTWPRDADGNWTEEKYCREPGTYCGAHLPASRPATASRSPSSTTACCSICASAAAPASA